MGTEGHDLPALRLPIHRRTVPSTHCRFPRLMPCWIAPGYSTRILRGTPRPWETVYRCPCY